MLLFLSPVVELSGPVRARSGRGQVRHSAVITFSQPQSLIHLTDIKSPQNHRQHQITVALLCTNVNGAKGGPGPTVPTPSSQSSG